MPSGCKRERNVFTILNFCVTRYRLFDDTQELRQEWKLEKIKSSFFFKNFFVCYTPGYDMGYLPIFVENMVVLGIFFLSIYDDFLYFLYFLIFVSFVETFVIIFKSTFLMWFDKIPLVGVQSGSLYFSGNNKTIRYDYGGIKYIYPNLPIVLKQ